MPDLTPDDRGGAAVAMSWVNRITGGSLLLLLPVVLGYWLDQYLQTEVLFLIIGSFLGVAIAACHLWRIVQDLEREGG